MNTVVIDRDKCTGCGLCSNNCPCHVLALQDGKATVAPGRCMKCGHCIAICPSNAFSISGYDMAEVKPYDAESFRIVSDVLLNAIKFRRSIRKFKKQQVDRESIEKIIEAGRFTPTGSNLQNVRYIVVESDNILRLEMETLRYYRKMKRLTGVFGKLVKPSFDFRQELEPGWLFPSGVPALILAISKDTLNAGLASMSMELMAEALELGTLYVRLFTRPANRNRKIRKILGLAKEENIVTCLAVGYSDVRYLRTVPRKKPIINWL